MYGHQCFERMAQGCTVEPYEKREFTNWQFRYVFLPLQGSERNWEWDFAKILNGSH
ncbi:hypothetical protein PcaKH35_03330 [Parageobacillus caldoxylosilyticus]|nr:hypothetical protein PcaKH35_03330 [Parageobacillus caldoxylosilyticus]